MSAPQPLPDDPVLLCRQGRISAPVALARLVLAGETADCLQSRLTTQDTDLATLLQDRRHALAGLAALAAHDHAAATAPGQIAAFFDAAVAAAPEASVAFYSLGDPILLARATTELVAWLDAQNLLGGDVVDLGCGIGRVAQALAPRCRHVLGLDVSPGMIAQARARVTAGNVRFAVTPGADLAALPAAGADLILAVDSFPYVVQAGAADAHLADAARILRPGGALVLLNLSYRNDAADRADLQRWQGQGWRVRHNGVRPFQLWDGAAFVLLCPRA